MPWSKGNLIRSGGTVDICCKKCCEFDEAKKRNGGYCVHEGAVKDNDVCSLFMIGEWNNRFELRKHKDILISQVEAVMDGFATKEDIVNEINELLFEGNDLETVSKIIFANIDNWARWCSVKGSEIVWNRMDKFGIVINQTYCSHK